LCAGRAPPAMGVHPPPPPPRLETRHRTLQMPAGPVPSCPPAAPSARLRARACARTSRRRRPSEHFLNAPSRLCHREDNLHMLDFYNTRKVKNALRDSRFDELFRTASNFLQLAANRKTNDDEVDVEVDADVPQPAFQPLLLNKAGNATDAVQAATPAPSQDPALAAGSVSAPDKCNLRTLRKYEVDKVPFKKRKTGHSWILQEALRAPAPALAPAPAPALAPAQKIHRWNAIVILPFEPQIGQRIQAKFWTPSCVKGVDLVLDTANKKALISLVKNNDPKLWHFHITGVCKDLTHAQAKLIVLTRFSIDGKELNLGKSKTVIEPRSRGTFFVCGVENPSAPATAPASAQGASITGSRPSSRSNLAWQAQS
jgi:hypothetical protein